jgi:hypothetical protein
MTNVNPSIESTLMETFGLKKQSDKGRNVSRRFDVASSRCQIVPGGFYRNTFWDLIFSYSGN